MSRKPKFRQSVGTLSNKLDELEKITRGALIALAVGFVALFVSAVSIFHDSYTNKAATYLELTEEVRELNQQIEDISEMCINTKPPHN